MKKRSRTLEARLRTFSLNIEQVGFINSTRQRFGEHVCKMLYECVSRYLHTHFQSDVVLEMIEIAGSEAASSNY